MFENPFKKTNNEEKEIKKVELAPEVDHRTGIVRTKKDAEEERQRRIEDPSRYRDIR